MTVGPNGFLTSGHEDPADRVAIRSANGDLEVDLEADDGRPWTLLGGRIVNDDDDNEDLDSATVLKVNGEMLFTGGEAMDAWGLSGLHAVMLDPDHDHSMLDFSDEDAWISEWQPRTVLYEGLPGAIRRIHTAPCRLSSGSGRGVAVDLCGGRGEFTPAMSGTGIGYTWDRRAMQMDLAVPLSDRLTGWVGARLVHGEAEVATMTGQGLITVNGPGLHGGLHMEGDNDLYGKASFSRSNYDVELTSTVSGHDAVTATTEGQAHSLDIEAGRHFTLENGMQLTGRGWYGRAKASVDPFDDSENTSVSGMDRQTRAGIGLDVVRERETADGGILVLRGGVGLERILDEDSSATIDGDAFSTTARDGRLLLDLGGEYRGNDFDVRGEIFAHGLSADDTVLGLRIGLSRSF